MLAPRTLLHSLLALLPAVGPAAIAHAEAAPLAAPWIIDGAPATENEFPEVFALTFSRGGRTSPEPCAATLIHPTVLLTSRHCLPDDDDDSIAVQAHEGVDLRHPTRTHAVAYTRVHDAFASTRDEVLQTGYDFGLVVLREPITHVAPARLTILATSAARRRLFAADALTVVGYGSERKTALDETTGVRRYGRTRAIEAIEQQFSTEGPRAALAIGDSGGPAYLGRPGARALVGIASGVPKETLYRSDGRPDVSHYAAIRRPIVEWIEAKAGIALSVRELREPPADAAPARAAEDPFADFGKDRE